MSAITWPLAVFGSGRIEAQELAEGCRASPKHGGPNEVLDGFQIQMTACAPVAQDDSGYFANFAGDFALDVFDRFFSCGVSASSTDRRRQIFSLTTVKS